MTRTLCATALVLSFVMAPPLHAQITCDRFVVSAELRGNSVFMSLDTDLPDTTTIMVSVTRDFSTKGEKKPSSAPLFSQRSTVGKWTTPREITLDNAQWKVNLGRYQQRMQAAEIPFSITKIDDHISVNFTVPIGQDNSLFGNQNKKLTGQMVNDEGFFRSIRHEVALTYPIEQMKSQSYSKPQVDPRELVQGKSYSVSERTPLMPTHSPKDPYKAIEQMKQIPPDGSFTVLATTTHGTIPWYQVRAVDDKKRNMGTGWINSTALRNQVLRVVE